MSPCCWLVMACNRLTAALRLTSVSEWPKEARSWSLSEGGGLSDFSASSISTSMVSSCCCCCCCWMDMGDCCAITPNGGGIPEIQVTYCFCFSQQNPSKCWTFRSFITNCIGSIHSFIKVFRFRLVSMYLLIRYII